MVMVLHPRDYFSNSDWSRLVERLKNIKVEFPIAVPSVS